MCLCKPQGMETQGVLLLLLCAVSTCWGQPGNTVIIMVDLVGASGNPVVMIVLVVGAILGEWIAQVTISISPSHCMYVDCTQGMILCTFTNSLFQEHVLIYHH